MKMRRMMAFAALLLVVISALAWIHWEGRREWMPPSVEVRKDLVYSRAGGHDLKLDLYRPHMARGKHARPFPVILFVHGGAWLSGDKHDYSGMASRLAARGYACVCINYRFCTEAEYPACYDDCRAALLWIRENSKKFNLDTRRWGLVGDSAGAHLISQLGLLEREKPRAIACYCGVYDLEKLYSASSKAKLCLPLLLRTLPVRNRECYRQASPVCHITKDAPPFLLIHGIQDRVVPISQSEEMLRKLKQNGVEASLIRVSNADHLLKPAGRTAVTPSPSLVEHRVSIFLDGHVRTPHRMDK